MQRGLCAVLLPPGYRAAALPAADCSVTQEFDAASATCACRQGWSGPGTCSACQTGAACDALFGTSGASCSSEVAFQQGMPFKAYTCDLAVSGQQRTCAGCGATVECGAGRHSHAVCLLCAGTCWAVLQAILTDVTHTCALVCLPAGHGLGGDD